MATHDDVVALLVQSAALVQAWGEVRLPNGKTLAEALTVQKVPFWDALAVDLARVHVPRALARGVRPVSLAQRVRPTLSRTKDRTLGLIRSWRSSKGCQRWPSTPAILLLGFGAYLYRDVLQPVADRLAKRTHVCPVSLYGGRRARATALVDHDGFESIWQHWDGERAIRELRRELSVAIGDLRSSGVLPSLIRDLEGQPLWPQLKDTFDRVLGVYLPRLLPLAAVARHILDRHRPALVLSPDVADPRTRLYTILAARRGIPSLEIQFGVAGPESIEWRFMAADRVAAWGKQAAEMLMAHGVPPERITVTGSPRHDDLSGPSDRNAPEARARLGIPEGNAMVLLASVYYLDEYSSVADPVLPELLRVTKRAVFEAAERTPGLSLVVKPHPQEDVAELKRLVGSRRNIRVVEPRVDIRGLIKVCDAFLALADSTSVLDALIANKLTIRPAFPGWIWSDFFTESGATVTPRSSDEIASCFMMVVDGSRARVQASIEPARRRLLSAWVGDIDGQASARIEALILDMAGLESSPDRHGLPAHAG